MNQVSINFGSWTELARPAHIRSGNYTAWSYVGNDPDDTFIFWFNHVTGQSGNFPLGLAQSDNHNTASFMVRQDGRLVVFYARHNTDRLFRWRISTNPRDASSWGAENSIDAGGAITYTSPIQIGQNIYVLTRVNNGFWQVQWSDDQAVTFRNSTGIWDGRGQPYAIWKQNRQDNRRIYVSTIPRNITQNNVNVYSFNIDASDSNPSNWIRTDPTGVVLDPTSSVSGALLETDLTASSLAFTSATGFTNWGVADIEYYEEKPVVLIANHRNSDNQFEMVTSYWDGSMWVTHSLGFVGGHIETTPTQRLAAKGMFSDRTAEQMIIAKEVNGVFELFRYEGDPLNGWSESEQLTSGSTGVGTSWPFMTRNRVPGQGYEIGYMDVPSDTAFNNFLNPLSTINAVTTDRQSVNCCE